MKNKKGKVPGGAIIGTIVAIIVVICLIDWESRGPERINVKQAKEKAIEYNNSSQLLFEEHYTVLTEWKHVRTTLSEPLTRKWRFITPKDGKVIDRSFQ